MVPTGEVRTLIVIKPRATPTKGEPRKGAHRKTCTVLMGYAEGPTARSAPRRICTRSESWELCAVGRMRFQASFVLLTNFARNSPTAVSKIELWSLELQRFWMLLKFHAIELHAEFLVCVSVVTHGHRSLVQRLPHMMRIRIGCCYLDRL